MDIQLEKIKVNLPNAGKLLFSINELTIPFGSKVLIEGASGKGKTTLLHLIAGLFLPDDGKVNVGSHCISSLSDENRALLRRKHMGLIFQKLNLIEFLTAAENVALALTHAAVNRDIIEKALDEVNLKDRYDDRSAVMSLGEQQRVAVSRILAAQPEIVLADEPTSSLDSTNGDLVLDALFKASENKTLIVVSHDQRLRERFERVIRFEEMIST